jgi:hypothetical protein
MNTMQTSFKKTYIKIKLSYLTVSTHIHIVIQRYLRNLRYKTSVKHVHIDRNITLNTEPFPLGLIVVLSGWCHFTGLVCFDEYEPLRFTVQPYTESMHYLWYNKFKIKKNGLQSVLTNRHKIRNSYKQTARLKSCNVF